MSAPCLVVGDQRIPLAADGLPEGMPSDHGVPTLGWGVLAWGEEFLAQPDGDRAGDPWQWTPTQARLIAWWFAVDRTGRWLFRRGQIVKPKGSGKSPLAAALSCCALAADVVFDGFDAAGEAVGRPHPSPHVQLAAVSQDQTDNTMSLVLSMLRDGEAADAIPGLDLGLTRVRTRNGKLEPVTASAPSREGQRLTDAILDEPHLWTNSNGGVRMAATLRRNLGKMNGRSLETTNAWTPGEESVAEQTAIYADKIASGDAVDLGLMRYHPQAQVRDLGDPDELRAGLVELYADAPWVDVDRVIAEIYDLGTHPADARRFYLNQVVTAEDGLVSPVDWDACRVDDRLEAGDRIALGFDGSIRDDATVLIACRVEDRLFFPLGMWERPDGPAGEGWEVDREAVDEAVHAAFELYEPLAFFADVEHWESYIDAWTREYRERLLVKASPREPIAWDMRGRLQQSTLANERLVAAVVDGKIRHTGDVRLRRHVLNARRRPNRYGISFGKDRRGSRHKVDGWAGCLLADMAQHELEASGKNRTVDRRVVVFR
ncbi:MULTISPECIES: phage terminase family protein [Nocardiopsidaceae]|uniref:Phage terminase family protein n=1 Tax=Marinactinospora rubrisoli TaxID=2715399 RepID=A0ABW2KP72_9ACTN|nr:phage terminase family protein [Marinitenerispora sediminis]